MKNNEIRKIKKVKRKYIAWDQDAERLVLYADVMGFKSRVMTRSHEQLKQEFLDFRKAWDARVSPLKLNDFLKFVQFSDSMMMEKKFPLKGAIAQGIFGFYADRQLYFGQPLCDAAVLHDQLKFYGIAVHHSAEKTVRSYSTKLLPYSKTPIYIDKGKVCHYHLCWNLLDNKYQSNDITMTCEKWLQTIEESVSGEPRMYVDRTLEILRKDSEVYQAYPHGEENGDEDNIEA